MASTERRTRRAGRWPLALAVALGAGVPVAGVVATAGPAAAYPSGTVSLSGHGYGPGDGMGQWGAIGDALAGMPYAAILAHFYGGTAPETLTGATNPPESHTVSVVMTEFDGLTTVVTSPSAFTVAGQTIPGGGSVRLTPTGSGGSSTWTLARGTGCTGAFTTFGTPVATATVVPTLLAHQGLPPTAADDLELCEPSGTLNVEGQVEAEYNSAAASRIFARSHRSPGSLARAAAPTRVRSISARANGGSARIRPNVCAKRRASAAESVVTQSVAPTAASAAMK